MAVVSRHAPGLEQGALNNYAFFEQLKSEVIHGLFAFTIASISLDVFFQLPRSTELTLPAHANTVSCSSLPDPSMLMLSAPSCTRFNSIQERSYPVKDSDCQKMVDVPADAALFGWQSALHQCEVADAVKSHQSMFRPFEEGESVVQLARRTLRTLTVRPDHLVSLDYAAGSTYFSFHSGCRVPSDPITVFGDVRFPGAAS